MKKGLIIIIILILIGNAAFSQNKRFDKLINEYDIFEYVKDLDCGKPDLFWDAVWRNNERLEKLADACGKHKEAVNEARKIMRKAYLDALCYDSWPVVEDLQFIADTLISRMGMSQIYPNIKMHIVDFESINACATPDGVIYLNAPITSLDNFSHENIVGICAHEFTHFLLQHSFEQVYAVQKKLKRNKLIASIGTGLAAAANAMNNTYDNKHQQHEIDVDKIKEALFVKAKDDTNKYRFKYSRNQELEADIVAYRFLEYMGYGGQCYIEALEKIGYDNDVYYSDDSDHPTIKFRVELLNYIASKNK